MPRKKDPKKREDLLRVSMDIVCRKNYKKITIDDIVNESKIGRNLFYSEYGSKRKWYEKMRRDHSEQCWNDVIRHYLSIKDGTFSEKMKKTAVYLMVFARSDQDFRTITQGEMMWRSKFADMISSDSEIQQMFNQDLNEYAAKMKMDPKDVRMNVYMLLTTAVRCGYDAAEHTVKVPYSTAVKNISYTADHFFPKG